MEDYAQKVYDDIYEGIRFKVKKLDPIEHITLVTKDLGEKKMDFNASKEYIRKCLSCFLWTKNDTDWFPLLDSTGGSKLPELDREPKIALDLFYIFEADVVKPVFIESKTFRNYIEASKPKKSGK